MVKLNKVDLRKSGDIRLAKIKIDLTKHGKKVNLKKSVWWVAENCDETGYKMPVTDSNNTVSRMLKA